MSCFKAPRRGAVVMRVWAISDLHVDHDENREALAALPPHPEDWLIVAGDISHREADQAWTLALLRERFARVIWAPGNHDLWTEIPAGHRGEERYRRLVALCREHGVLTPEDPYASLVLDGRTYAVAPLFLLYDYSFRPVEVAAERAVQWALEDGVLCADEHYLDPEPHASRAAWCATRCALAEQRLAGVPREHALVIVNHFPLRQDLIRIRIPRFSIWCGTKRTVDWHTRFNTRVVVSGHLHVRTTRERDGVRFEEVSLGYPRQWNRARPISAYLRQILPEPGRGAAEDARDG